MLVQRAVALQKEKCVHHQMPVRYMDIIIQITVFSVK
jgi:hypothetical protein